MESRAHISTVHFGNIQEFSCQVHPVVPLGIIQHIVRWPEDTKTNRVTGLVLGTNTGSLVEMKHSIPLRAAFQNKRLNISVTNSFDLAKLIKRAQSKATIVGVYYTGEIDDTCIKILSVIKKKIATPVLLLSLDMHDSGYKIQSYVLSTFSFKSFCMLKPIPTQVDGQPLLRLKQPTSLETSISRIRELIQTCKTYLEDVVSQKTPPNLNFFKQFSKILSINLPESGLINSNDLQLVKYLSELAKTQVLLTDQVYNNL